MKLYLDTCCLNRPFDDPSQDRIRLEAEAVLIVLNHVSLGDWELIVSDVLEEEILQHPNKARRERLMAVLAPVQNWIRADAEIKERALTLQEWGFQPYDSLHVACAEAGGADVMLTTDDKMLAVYKRYANRVHSRLLNPLKLLDEEFK